MWIEFAHKALRATSITGMVVLTLGHWVCLEQRSHLTGCWAPVNWVGYVAISRRRKLKGGSSFILPRAAPRTWGHTTFKVSLTVLFRICFCRKIHNPVMGCVCFSQASKELKMSGCRRPGSCWARQRILPFKVNSLRWVHCAGVLTFPRNCKGHLTLAV